MTARKIIIKGIARLVPQSLKPGFALLSNAERISGLALVPLVALSALLDLLAMSALLPFMAAIIAPDKWLGKSRIGHLLTPLLPDNPKGVVIALSVSIAVLLILAGALNIIVRRAINLYNAKCRVRLTRELLDRLMAVPYAWFLESNSALTARRVNIDVSKWGLDFVGRTFSVIQTVVLSLVAMTMVAFIAPTAGGLTAVTMILLTMALSGVTRSRMRYYGDTERREADLSTLTLAQLLAGIKDVKLSGVPGEFGDRAVESFTRIADVQTKRNTLRQVLPVLTLLTGQIAMILVITVLWWIGRPANQIAEQMVFLALVSARLLPAANRMFTDLSVLWDVMPYVNGLHQLHTTLTGLGKSANRQRGMLEFPPEWDEIRLVDLGYRYPGAENPSLGKINISIKRGRAYGVAGPSGAGKTTLVDVLLKLLEPTSGQLLIDGLDTQDVLPDAWREKIGYVAQQPFMVDDSLLANIAFGIPVSQVDRAWAMECVRRANLEPVMKDLAEGLETRLGERGVRLSVGQRQRVAIARALYKRPDVLILDEATSALDTIAEQAIQEAIARLHGETTLIVIAHRLSTIRECDEIWLLESGSLSNRGTYGALLEKSELFRRLVAGNEPAPNGLPAVDQI